MTYQLTTSNMILRITDETFIPPDPANTDYAAYLAWVEEGNTPEPAPAPEPPAPAPDYLAFWDALMVSTVYAAIRERSVGLGLMGFIARRRTAV